MLTISLTTFCGCGSGSSDASSKGNKPSTYSEQGPISSLEQMIIPENNDYSKMTFQLAEVTKYLKLDGRWATTKTSADLGAVPCITFDHTAQLLAFNADCEGEVTLKMSNYCSEGQSGRNERYFLVEVDGKQTRMRLDAVAGAESYGTLVLATKLKRGVHSFKIYRQTELNFGYTNLVSLTMNGVLIERPADKELYIEFLGDSVTAGFGNLTLREDAENPSYPAKSSGTDTYAFKTATALNADISAVARSGLAYSYGLNMSISDYWNRTSWARAALGEYKPQRQPDVVVIALGTNDHNYYKQHGVTEEQLYQVAYDLIKLVRETRPDSKIVWYYGIMGTGYDDDAGLRVKDYIARAIKDNGGEKANIYLCMSSFTNFDGGGWHPDQKGHEQGAKELTEFIKTIL